LLVGTATSPRRPREALASGKNAAVGGVADVESTIPPDTMTTNRSCPLGSSDRKVDRSETNSFGVRSK
jgi:hypothetical protein